MKNRIITTLAVSSLMTLGWTQENTNVLVPDVRSDADENLTTNVEKNMKYTSYKGVLDSSAIVSAEVFNMQEEEIGNIDRLLINSESGSVEHAVVSVGGFLGIGDRLVAVPWSSFEVKQEMMRTSNDADIEDQKLGEANLDERESEEIVADNEERAEVAEDAAEENDARDSDANEERFAAPTLHIYLDTDKERLSEAPEFDPDKPSQLGSSEYWQKDWKKSDAEKMKKDPATTSTDKTSSSRKLSSSN